MAHFAQAFWSSDYAGGLGVLFVKLQQGVKENEQVLTIARMRADAEELYGQHIADIGPETDRIADGFQRDDGATVRKAYEGVRQEMEEAAKKHRKIASNIRELVVYPFGRWCDQHAARIQNSHDDLQARVKGHDKQMEAVKKLRAGYFNKCRLLEDMEEEDKLAFKDPEKKETPSQSPNTPTVKIQEPEEEEEQEPVEIGDQVYDPKQIKEMLAQMLTTIPLGETKVPILGTYQNVTSGADIVDYVQRYMNTSNMSQTEQIGQDLVDNGFLRLVGNVGNTFANSSKMKYQWRSKAFQITGLPEKRTTLGRSNTVLSDTIDSPIVNSVQEYIAGWNPLNNQFPNETPGQKLKRETRDADERYKDGVKKLDLLRCQLEEAMIEHLKFMERCELDRLKAIKSVILDFSGALSNVIPSLQSTVDKMMLFQETVQPLADLRYILENYRTGPFVPKVTAYENYYNSIEEQTFGVDIEARAKADRKRVPLIITTVLNFLDHSYPLLEGDEARRAIWLVDVPLAATHRLRNEINEKGISREVLEPFEVPVVASVLKLYLLELPDSIVSSNFYEIIKSIYSSASASISAEESNRITVLTNTLGQLRLTNIASLDAITTHFARLIELTSATPDYIATLTTSLAPCILRPRLESPLSFEEKYSLRFLRDLLEHKDAIFGELKRVSTVAPSASVLRAHASLEGGGTTSPTSAARPRAASSTDERDRRANMEERNRAIASRSRASSPVPAPDHERFKEQARHRRDSSRGPMDTRFPVAVGTGTSSPRHVSAPHPRGPSLEVPLPLPPRAEAEQGVEPAPATNGQEMVEVHAAPAAVAAAANVNVNVGKSNSLGRSAHVTRKPPPGAAGVGNRDSAGSLRSLEAAGGEEGRAVGVELADRGVDGE